jgi:hypothetical protein
MEFHFKKALTLLWPQMVWHRWNELFVKEWLTHKHVGILGPTNASKSHSAAICHLLSYYADPDHTTVIVCSNTKESLENRIWGEMKKLHRDATTRFRWLSGNLIEGKLRIVTDARTAAEEGRDFRNGLMGVAAYVGGTMRGISCFVAGTPVDTVCGLRAIETIRTGDMVKCAVGFGRVKRTTTQLSPLLVTVKLSNGTSVDCTPHHPFFTSVGWVDAACLTKEHRLISLDEAMQILRQGYYERWTQSSVLRLPMQNAGSQKEMSNVRQDICSERLSLHFLFKELLREVEYVESGNFEESFRGSRSDGGRPERERHSNAESERKSPSFGASQGQIGSGSIRVGKKELEEAICERRESFQRARQWVSTIEGGISFDSSFSGSHPGAGYPYEARRKDVLEQNGLSALLSSRFGVVRFEAFRGSGRRNPFQTETDGTGCEENRNFDRIRVDSVKVHEPRSIGGNNERQNGYRVYNLEVEGHPSFSVHGQLVHNSLVGIKNKHLFVCGDELQTLPKSFLDSLSNLMKSTEKGGTRRCTGMGNPSDTLDSLGMLCEPAAYLGGWDSGIDQTPKTKTWATRWPDGICIQFCGSDSPNMDVPADSDPPYPFLINKKDMEDDAAKWGTDDWHYTMFNEGRMPRGQGSHRVLTRALCEKGHAKDEALWLNSNRTYIAFLDAAYTSGGDRCVFGILRFGTEAKPLDSQSVFTNLISQEPPIESRSIILELVKTMVIPINTGIGEMPEDTIVEFVRSQCQQSNIPPENFFYDSGMKTALVQAFSRIWSPKVNSVDCGGVPSEDMVSANIPVMAKDYYSKKITEIWYSVRLVVEAGQFRGMTEEVMMEFCSREFKKVGTNKIEVESKVEMKKKSGKSPDFADAVAIGVHGARQKGFIIRNLGALHKPSARNQAWKRELQSRATSLRDKGQLDHAA